MIYTYILGGKSGFIVKYYNLGFGNGFQGMYQCIDLLFSNEYVQG